MVSGNSPKAIKLRADPSRALVLLATTTDEKLAHYNTIARERDFPLEFRRLNEIVDAFHSAAEDRGDRLENANQKFEEIEDIIAFCRRDGSAHQGILKKKCAEWGIHFDKKKIFFATEDSTISMPKPIWANLRGKLARHVSVDLLESADKNGAESGPGAETGPILAAVGFTRFFNLLRDAARETNGLHKPAFLTDLVTCILTPLEHPPGAPTTIIETKTPQRLYAPNGLDVPLSDPPTPIAQTSYFLSWRDRPNQPLADYWEDFLINHSARAKVVEGIVKQIPALPAPEPASIVKAAARRTASRRDFAVVQMQNGPILEAGALRVAKKSPPLEGDHAKVLNLQPSLNKGDAFVFPPFDASDEILRRNNYYKLVSVMVAKQLESSHMNTPIVVMDDGCWTPFLEWSYDLANQGMNKDYIRTPFLEGRGDIMSVPGVEHRTTGYFDIVSGSNPAALKKAARQIAGFRQEQYSQYQSPSRKRPKEPEKGGNADPQGRFTVAAFLSASSDNLRLIREAGEYGQFLAENGDGLVWGAGDRHAMGAVFDKYAAHDGKWCAGFSTPTIVKAETKFGRMPRSDYWELCPDIFVREARMIEKASLITVFPGGAGTVKELAAVLVAKDLVPDMRDKPLIIYNPALHEGCSYPGKPFWNKGIEVLMGKEFLGAITADHKAYADRGIYMASDMDELKRLTGELRDAHDLGRRTETAPKAYIQAGISGATL